MAKFSDLLGKVLVSAIVTDDGDEIFFMTQTGETYKLYHEYDCCESVYVEDVCGNWKDLIGHPILQAEEVTNIGDPPKHKHTDSYTWTFYKLATIKGSVSIRWYGESNGYYSESVSFEKVAQ